MCFEREQHNVVPSVTEQWYGELMIDAADQETKTPELFPRTFWTANATELFERGAYYSMISFVLIYLSRLGMGSYWPGDDFWPATLSSLLWTLVYFLPILSGTIADHIGFRKALLIAFVLLASGYLLMGAPVWIEGAELSVKGSTNVLTASTLTAVCVVGAIVLIGFGGSVIKPCISGTVQKTAGTRATLAFAIFYMVINIGSVVGRGVAYVARKEFSLVSIFAVAAAFSVAAFFVVLLVYRDPETEAGAAVQQKPQRSVGRILIDMITVLRNPRFSLFLFANAGFAFLYNQVYTLFPLYLKDVLETEPNVEIYTMANPLTIVCFQLAITKMFGKIKPIISIVIGTILIGLSMIINLYPVFAHGGPRAMTLGNLLPIGSMFIVMTVALVAFGELFASARTYEYIGALAPKGKEGLFLGYANLPMAIGSLAGGPVGVLIFSKIMCKNSVTNADGLLDLDPMQASMGWGVLMMVGFASAAGMWAYNRWVTNNPVVSAEENTAQAS